MSITEVFGTLDPFTVEQMWDQGMEPDQTLGRWDWLVALVEALPPEQRDVIEALYWEQVGQRTYAERMGLRRAEVRTRQRLALRTLQKTVAGVQATFEWMAAQ